MNQFGLAKTHFLSEHGRSPWNPAIVNTSFTVHDWPLLEKQLNDKRITYFDFILTQQLLRNFSPVDECTAFFICHLIMAGKKGHLCVEISNKQLFPTIFQLWNNEASRNLTFEELETITQLILSGSSLIPSPLVTYTENTFSGSVPFTPICRFGNYFYLQKHWMFETHFLEHFYRHIQVKPTIEIEIEQVRIELDQMQTSGELNEEQARSIVEACVHPVTLITGGPGTGKSYTAGKLINILRNNLKSCETSNFQMVLAAPTGKAAANLQKSLEKSSPVGIPGFPSIQAKTLHALLNIRRSDVQISNLSLNADLVVVDECSMIDICIMSKLFESLKKGSRIILLGDPHQLPSVGAGSVFVDLNRLHRSGLPISHIHLKTCLRAELKSIIEFAELVKNSHADEAISMLNHSSEGVLKLKLNADQNTAQKELISYLEPLFYSFVDSNVDRNEIFKSFNAIRLLSPVRKGLFGVDTLNQLIWKTIIRKNVRSQWLAVPIMISTNDHQQDLFNGDTGILFRKFPLNRSEKEDYALFTDRTKPDELRRLPAFMLPKYELAYCLSVHKSQGSEFDRVILALPEGSELFGREIFYTAITRARKKIEIWGSDVTLKKTILNRENRLSNIEKRFNQLWKPE